MDLKGQAHSGQGAPPGRHPAPTAALAREVNEEGRRAVVDHPGRFGLLASLPLPDVDAALSEIAHCCDELDVDGFAVLTNSAGTYLGDPALRALRDLGPVVHLDAHDLLAVTRYDDVRRVLDDDTTFVSGQGVALNDVINELGRGTTLMSDGDEHRTQREIIGRPLTPKALAELRHDAQDMADALIEQVVERGRLDAVTDLAQVLPATWVPDLLGWPDEGREHLLDWAGAVFDVQGPLNERALAATDAALELGAYAQTLAESELPPHCFGARIQQAVASGEIEPERCPMLFVDYLAPSLDTTISAIGNALWLFATHPDQWQLLREDPGRTKAAVNEALRMESPVTCFTQVAPHGAEIDGAEVPAGARLLVSYTSANRDERRWSDPDRFDITRESAGHLAFGHGEHACVGMGLARLESTAVLTALARRVTTIELAGPAVRKHNNLIRSFESIPIRVTT